MKIRLVGVRNHLGVGVHFSNIVDALKHIHGIGQLVEEVDSTSFEAMTAAAERSQPEDVNICFSSMNLQNHFRGTVIQWIVFESTRVPEIVMPTMLAADQVWVPSEWGRNTLIANGMPPNRCEVIPEGVDTDAYHPWYSAPNPQPLKFLTVGKFEQRKSHQETLLAWRQTFGNDSGVELTVKTNHFVNAQGKQASLTDFINSIGLTNVRTIWDSHSAENMADLYRQHHVFVLPSKGEGWGLPLIEAAASGMPIITTMYSAQTQFLYPIRSSVIPVAFELGDITCAEFQHFYPTSDQRYGQWAMPRVDSIVQALTQARNNYVALKQQAQQNALTIRRDFNWARSADLVVKTLHSRGLLFG